MTYISLGQAAKGWKVGKATLSRAIRDGKLSVKAKLGDGTYQLDPAEVARYMAEHRPERAPVPKRPEAGPERSTLPDLRLIQAEIKACELEATRRALDERIGDLKAMLEETRSDRDHWRDQAGKVHLLLTDQTAPAGPRPSGPAIGAVEEPGRSWWRRLVG